MTQPKKSQQQRSVGSLATFGALMEQLPIGTGPATTSRREKVWAQVNAQRTLAGPTPRVNTFVFYPIARARLAPLLGLPNM